MILSFKFPTGSPWPSSLAAAFLMRSFIIAHDCGHGAFFRSRTANTIVGTVTSLFAFTPYDQWRHEHAVHHASGGDLDGRGIGDVWTMTVAEYARSPCAGGSATASIAVHG